MDINEQYNEMVERMLEHVNNGTTDQAESTMTVPASAYTDPNVWQSEVETVFKRLPLLVALSIELPEPGDFKTLDILEKPLLITRQKDGSVRVVLNVCRHRGMLLAAEEKGNRTVFSCPYHGWSYRADGSLKGVAGSEKFGQIDPEAYGLEQLPVYESGGLIFAVLTPGLDPNFEGYFGGMQADIKRLNFENWHYCGKREVFGANWKIAFDGYLEGYHFAAAHRDTLAPIAYSNTMAFDAHGPHLLIGFPEKSIGDLGEIDRDELWRHEHSGYNFIRTLFPHVSIFVAAELTQIAQLIPGPTPAENRTVLHFLCREAPVDEAAVVEIEEKMNWLHNIVDKEDYQLGLKIQRGLQSGAIDHVVFGRNERGNQHFHKWLQYYLDDTPGRPQPTL